MLPVIAHLYESTAKSDNTRVLGLEGAYDIRPPEAQHGVVANQIHAIQPQLAWSLKGDCQRRVACRSRCAQHRFCPSPTGGRATKEYGTRNHAPIAMQ